MFTGNTEGKGEQIPGTITWTQLHDVHAGRRFFPRHLDDSPFGWRDACDISGISSLKEKQVEAITALMRKRDVFVCLPTGIALVFDSFWVYNNTHLYDMAYIDVPSMQTHAIRLSASAAEKRARLRAFCSDLAELPTFHSIAMTVF